MFNGIKSFFRRVGEMMGLLQQINEATDFKKIPLSNEYYRQIALWGQLYRGYSKEIHDTTVFTLDGPKDYTMDSLGMPKVVSQKLATLIFNERCEISVSAAANNDEFGDFIQETFKENKFYANFQQQLEFMFAKGGLVGKPYPYLNADGSYCIKIAYVQADGFYPITWDNVRVTEGLFTSSVYKNGKTYTHLEWHLKDDTSKGYLIRNQLFESELNELGKEVPLNTVFPDMEREVVFPNLDRPLFTYIKPNLANNLDSYSPLGISVFANSLSTLKQIDTFYDSLRQEVELGKKRIMVSSLAVKKTPSFDFEGNNNGIRSTFDTGSTIFESVGIGEMDKDFVKEIDFNLRITEIVDGINANLNLLAMQLGFSQGTFSFSASQGLKTATEVISERSETFQTKQAHENVIEEGIADLIEVIAILADRYDIIKKPTEYEVTVSFDDSIIQDRKTDIDEQTLLLINGLQSKLRAVMKLHGLTEQEALELLAEIKRETLQGEPSYEDLKSEYNLFGLPDEQ